MKKKKKQLTKGEFTGIILYIGLAIGMIYFIAYSASLEKTIKAYENESEQLCQYTDMQTDLINDVMDLIYTQYFMDEEYEPLTYHPYCDRWKET